MPLIKRLDLVIETGEIKLSECQCDGWIQTEERQYKLWANGLFKAENSKKKIDI